jgi:hypothetical protein
MRAASLAARSRPAPRAVRLRRQPLRRAAARPAWRGCATLSRRAAAERPPAILAGLAGGLRRLIAAFRESNADGLDGATF